MRLRFCFVASLLLAACGADEQVSAPLSSAGSSGTGGGAESGSDAADFVPATFEVRPGVEIVTVTKAKAAAPLTLFDATGKQLVTMIADEFGQAHFAYIPSTPLTIQSGHGTEIPIADGRTLQKGNGYVIRNDAVDPPERSEPFDVLGVKDVPDPSVYDGQPLNGVHFGLTGIAAGENADDGFNYVTMRDGVKLGVMVRWPDKVLWGSGPYPTVIEYSGYSPSRPSDPEPGSRIATLLGFASVGVNMRGTGCSGGVFDVFSPAQHADGYDAVEIVARQSWVLHNTVGMVGLSYSGIAQLFVGRTAPPSLSAITPLSVIADPWQQLWPGGIYNDGFTKQWLQERDNQAAPGGQSWTDDRIAAGDTICDEHQQLRNQNIEFEAFFKMLKYYPDSALDRSLPLLVKEIEVPVYLTGAWQDEQTGPQFTGMLDRFTGTDIKKFTMFNGRHPDGYSPLVLTRWFEFLNLYVAKRVPRLSTALRDLAGPEFSKQFGVEGLGFEPDRFADFADDDYAGVLAAYEAEPMVRVLFESGAAGPAPGAPAARFEATYAAWPPPDAAAKSLYLGANGSLGDTAPGGAGGFDSYVFDPDAGSTIFFGPKGYELLAPIWDIDWTQFPDDASLSYLTAPLAADLVIAGPSYADLWIASDAGDATVQVTLSEVRPDGNEVLLQSGWLRLGHRKVDEAASDTFRIVRTFKEADFLPLVPGEPVEAKVALPSVAAALRAGSRLRVVIATPGRNHGTWQFANSDYGASSPRFHVARSASMPSHVVLPIVEGVPVVAGVPACPSLRGQPCRAYVASANAQD